MSIAYCKPYVVPHISPPRVLIKTALSEKMSKNTYDDLFYFIVLDIQPLV